ncbi:unnamed protein product [Somion occarium]|uniref:Diaminohydroxyphosphoribosylamino-pyrimidine deaminase n=1 Tax=Somion occarium TaxID=3059160 RepID=A0ABP1DKD9_9APHY
MDGVEGLTSLASQHVQRGLCCLPSGSTLISDADEEVFLLYTNLAAHPANEASSDNFRGLGYLDSTKDVVALTFELKGNLSPAASESVSSKSRKRIKKRQLAPQDRTVEIQLMQDKTALRSRKGDTGSVVWRASIELAQNILQHFHKANPDALLNRARLQDSHVLELGAGTGLLGIALSPLVRHYTVTDIEDLMPLIRKNLSLNLPDWNSLSSPLASGPNAKGTITAEPLDWLALHNCNSSIRKKLFSYDPIDLLLVVDCIYHPSLLPALVQTIDHLSTPQRTAVLVVVELRAEDVVREFLELWLAASGGGVWEVFHVNGMLEEPYVVWVGWKKS